MSFQSFSSSDSLNFDCTCHWKVAISSLSSVRSCFNSPNCVCSVRKLLATFCSKVGSGTMFPVNRPSATASMRVPRVAPSTLMPSTMFTGIPTSLLTAADAAAVAAFVPTQTRIVTTTAGMIQRSFQDCCSRVVVEDSRRRRPDSGTRRPTLRMGRARLDSVQNLDAEDSRADGRAARRSYKRAACASEEIDAVRDSEGAASSLNGACNYMHGAAAGQEI